MTLYTVVPLELVLDGIQSKREPALEIEHRGMLLQVEPVAPGTGRLIRIVHGPLEGYLNSRYAPGELIHYS